MMTLSSPRQSRLTYSAKEGFTGKLLVVDDDDDARNSVARLLELAGYNCLSAIDGESALTRLSEDVVLMLIDIYMPHMDGVELMMRVLAEAERPDMAVIVISGNGTLERAVEAMRLGASDYVAKPYNMDDLLLRVERAIERREMILEHQTTILELQALLQHQGSEIGSAMGEMMQAYNGTLEALAAALDLRDKETEGHSRRVTDYSTAIARTLGLRGEALDVIRQGALLHDVGKIGIPDSILHKPSALNSDEWRLMRRHPEIGAQLLHGIDFLDDAVASIVIHHHERFDGGGYPHKLKGEAIPFGARIFAVADTLDAMTSDRVYRKGKPVREAREEIARLSGMQFDPVVVEAFMCIPDDGIYAIQNSVAILNARQPQEELCVSLSN
ncbi:MAG: HD domain-containing phosphohydrolase [Chloroflexota bacterium]